MLNILTTHTKIIIKGHKDLFGGDDYVYYLDCGDSIIGVCICPNPSNCIC